MEKIIKHNSIDWNSSTDLESIEIKWIPIFSLEFREDYSRIFGLTSDGYWMNKVFIGGNETISVVREKSEYIGLITVFEKDRTFIERNLLEGLKENTAGNYSLAIFPFLDLIKYALSEPNLYWATLASNWLKQEEIDEELCEIIFEIVDQKRFNQNLRHHLFKLMKRYEQSKKS